MSIEAINELIFKHPKHDKDFNTHLHNTELFLKLWKERVTPEMVIKDLYEWSCGTQACAGGHMTTWPEFHAIGGYYDNYYVAPLIKMPDDVLSIGTNVSLYLFRNKLLFSSRSDCIFKVYDDDKDYLDISDYDLVTMRFENWIKYLKDKMNQ